MIFPNRLLILATLMLATSAANAEELYDIKLSRPFKVGMQYDRQVTATMKQKTTLKIAGAQADRPREEEFQLELSGRFETLEVDDDGHETQLAVTVEKFERIQDEKREPLAEPGQVIIARSEDGETQFSLKNGELSPAAQSMLPLVIDVHDPQSADDDDIFGTDEKQPIGGSWLIDSEVLARDFARQDLGTVDPADVKGRSTLVSIMKEDGTPCLHIQGELHVSRFGGQMKDGTRIAGGEMTAAFAGLFPIDNATLPLADSVAMEMRLTVKAVIQGHDATVETELTRTREGKTRMVE